MQTITGIILGISMGGTVLIGRCVGAGKQKDAAKAVGTLTVLFAAAAAILTPVMLLCTGKLVALMETPEEAVLYTVQYVTICACGIPFIIGYNGVSGIFRGIGDSKTPVYFIAIACAVATMTAQNIGAGKPDRALKALRCGIGYSLICGLAVCLYAQFLPETLTGIFAKDGQVISAAAAYLRSYSIDCILVSFVFCMNSYFSGSQKAVVSFIHSMIATFAVRIPMTWLLSETAGRTMYTMGLAAPSASVVSIIICAGYFLYMRRKDRHS